MDKRIAIYKQKSLFYPKKAPYFPPHIFAEYPFRDRRIDKTNEVYFSVRELLNSLGLDSKNFNTKDWDPFSFLISRGQTVLIKPNFMRHFSDKGGTTDGLITHGSVIRAVVDYVYIALQGQGRIIIADGPMDDGDFEKICKITGLFEIRKFYKDNVNFDIEIYDLRRQMLYKRFSKIVRSVKLTGDPLGYTSIDLASKSRFKKGASDYRKFMGGECVKKVMMSHHNESKNEYLISNTYLDADVVINIPKMKTHNKAGVTLSLKNLVGITGDRDWLPHFSECASKNRDNRKNDHIGRDAILRVIKGMLRFDFIKRFIFILIRPFKDRLRELIGLTEFDIEKGNWHGNDILWRTIADLAYIGLYADKDGDVKKTRKRKCFFIVDGIVAGEGDGPMRPVPKPCGVLVAGFNGLCVDMATTRIMGFDPMKIPQFMNIAQNGTYGVFKVKDTEMQCVSNVREWNKGLSEFRGNCLNFRPFYTWKGHIEAGNNGRDKSHKRFKKIITYMLFASFIFFPLGIFGGKKEGAWFPFSIPWNYCEDSRIDLSYLLDPPAGRHGYLKVKDGHFYFEDGVRARFWGLNIHSNEACFPTHGQAEDIAKRLAQLGCNAIRMHFLDYEAPAGIIDGGYDDSQHFSSSQMERLDYFIYQLKTNGIYVCFDVFGLGARKFKPGDDVPEFDKIKRGAGGISFFDERIVELSKKFARDFLSHKNPYTGNSYLNEPAIAMVEMTNENTLFLERIYKAFPPYYKEEIERLWKEWLVSKGRDPDMVKGEWNEDRQFMFELQKGYQEEMYGYLRSLGLKVPIGSSNIPYDSLILAADTDMDFMDMHVYWDLCDELETLHNRPLIRQDSSDPRTIVNTISMAKVYNKPLVSTEWGSNWPNDWRAVDVLTTASYAALSDWDAMFLYAYNGGCDMRWDDLENKIYHGTVVFNDPAKIGVFPLASLIFLRGDVSKADDVYRASYSISSLFNMKDRWKDMAKLAGTAYISRLEKVFYEEKDNSFTGIDYPQVENASFRDKKTVSDTKELIRDSEKGIFILKTPRTFSLSGFVGNGKEQEFNGVRFSIESDFATVTITSLDGEDISSSKRLLLAVVGRVKNKGQKLAPHITKKANDLRRDVYILNTGEAPILVEGIKGEVFIKKMRRKENLRVFALDKDGLRKSEVQVSSVRDGHLFEISGQYQTIYYEIERI